MWLTETLAHLFHPRRSNNHRSRLLHPESLFYLVGIVFTGIALVQVLSSFSPQLGGILGYASDITVEQVVTQTNQERARSGLPALAYNAQLSQSAAAKAADMFAAQYWAHTSPQGKEPWAFFKQAGYSYKVAGENLARDFSTTPDMMNAWMNSPTHKANIMNQRYQEIGIAVVNGTLDGVETTLVVQHFGTPIQAVAQVSPQAAQAPKVATVPVTETPRVTLQPTVASVAVVQEATPVVAGITRTPSRIPVVLSRFTVPGTSIGQVRYSPLQLLKALGVSIVFLLMITLVYDLYAVGHYHSARIVGKNLAHLLLLGMVAFLLVFFRAGSLGVASMIGK